MKIWQYGISLGLGLIMSGMPVLASVPAVVVQTAENRKEATIASDIRLEKIKVERVEDKADRLFEEGLQKEAEDIEAALKAWREASLLYREFGNQEKENQTLEKIELALLDLRQALNRFRERGDYQSEIKTLGIITDTYFKIRKFQQAEQTLREGVKSIENAKNDVAEKHLIAALSNRLEADWSFAAGFGIVADRYFWVLYLKGKFSWEEILDISKFNLFVSRYVRDRNGELSSLHGIGWAYRNLGRFYDAIDYYKNALQIAKIQQNYFHAAFLYVEIGIVYSDIGVYSESLKHFNQSLSLSSASDLELHGFVLTKIGTTYLSLRQFDLAFSFLQKALAEKDNFDHYNVLLGLGIIYSQRGDFIQALRSYQDALQRVPAGDPGARGDILNRIGLLHVQQQDYAKAMESFQAALLSLKSLNNLPGEAITLSNIASLLEKQNQPELAIAFYKQSVNLTESIRQNLRRLTLEEQKAYTESVAGTYRNLADLLIQQGRLSEAQAVLELLKLRELREFTRDAGIDSDGILLAAVEEKALNQILNQFATVGNFTQEVSNCQQTNCANLKQLEQQRDALNAAIQQEINQQRAILAKHFSTEAGTLTPDRLNAEARRIVNAQPGTILIYPLVLKDKVQILVAFQAGDGAVTFRPFESQVSAEQLFKTIQTFRQQLGETNAAGRPKADLAAVQATSQQLYTWLIKPLETELNNPAIKHLVFAPDSTTRYIPLAALYDGKQYLIQRFTISTITAASQTDTETRTPRPTGQQPMLLAMGASTFQNYNPLPNVPAELDAITQTNTSGDRQGIYPGSKYLDRTFDYEALQTSLRKGTYRILHLATHGAFKPGRVEESYLVPGRGQNLTTDLIDQLGNYGLGNIHLVVLSACETAVGDRASDGIEIPGISYFFLKNEVKSVMASLWRVNDASTALLMQQFYKHLANGMTKAEALRQAQLEFLQAKLTAKDAPQRSDLIATGSGRSERHQSPANFAHPYYWAPFILIGNSL